MKFATYSEQLIDGNKSKLVEDTETNNGHPIDRKIKFTLAPRWLLFALEMNEKCRKCKVHCSPQASWFSWFADFRVFVLLRFLAFLLACCFTRPTMIYQHEVLS